MKLFLRNAVFIYSYALLLVMIHAGITLMHQYVPTPKNQNLALLMVASWVLLIPLVNGFFYYIYLKIQQRNDSMIAAIIQGFNRFIAVMICLVSLILLPIIVAGLGVVAYVFVNTQFAQIEYVYAVAGVTIFLVLLTLIPKQFAPILTICEELPASDALEQSSSMVKKHFWGKGLLSVICFSLLITLFLGHFVFRMIPEPDNALQFLVVYEAASLALLPILGWIIVKSCTDLKIKLT